MEPELKIGMEIKIKTRDGDLFEGILMEIKNGYLSAVATLGIILTFPMTSITNITKV
jgi:hypothetical protein